MIISKIWNFKQNGWTEDMESAFDLATGKMHFIDNDFETR